MQAGRLQTLPLPVEPQEWNLWELERLVRDAAGPDAAAKRGAGATSLHYLRGIRLPDGVAAGRTSTLSCVSRSASCVAARGQVSLGVLQRIDRPCRRRARRGRGRARPCAGPGRRVTTTHRGDATAGHGRARRAGTPRSQARAALPGRRAGRPAGASSRAASLGRQPPGAPCGVEDLHLVRRHGGADRGDRLARLKRPGRQFELTEALAQRLGIEGTQQIRWRFARPSRAQAREEPVATRWHECPARPCTWPCVVNVNQ